MKSKKIITMITVLTLFFGCKEEKNITICTLEFVYGINITLINADTSDAIIDDVKVVIKDGNYEEIITNIESSTPFFGAGERAGTYIVTITSNKYKTFISDPIIVEANECHVIPELKTFKLVPII